MLIASGLASRDLPQGGLGPQPSNSCCAIDLCVVSSVDAFRHFSKVAVVIGKKDGTMDRESMKISAESGCTNSTGVSILDTTGTNHLISLEQPEILRALVH